MWEHKDKRHTVAGKEEKGERERIHKGTVKNVELLPLSRAGIEIVPKGNPNPCQRKLTDKRGGPCDTKQPTGSLPT